MKAPRQRRLGEVSATIAQTLVLMAALSVLVILSASAGDPSWWYDLGTDGRSAVAPQFTTNTDGTVTTNYIADPNGAVTVGQLKQFTARAAHELNSNLAGGAGTNLNGMVSNWATEYASSNYGTTNYKPSDYSIASVGQVKYIGNQVWTRLVAGGYTNAVPSWLAVNTNSDSSAAAIGQVKTVFNFSLSSLGAGGGGTAPIITSSSTVNASVGVSFSYTITATHSPISYTASNLPSWLAINTSTGVLSGTPPAAGLYSVGISATNASGTGTGFVIITVTSESVAPVIGSSLAISVVTGEPLTYQITATHNPTSFGASGLPSGLNFNSQTGVISGVAGSAGTTNVTLSAANSAGTGTATLVLSVTSAPITGGTLPVITSGLSATGTVGSPFSYQISATNNPTTYGAAGLPDGLHVETSTGAISGTPTSGGDYSIVISATNTSGTANAILVLSVNRIAPVIISPLAASATAGSPFVYNIVASSDPTSYGETGLPDGLILNPTTGLISGAPQAAGMYSVSLSAMNSLGTGSATLSLTVAPQSIAPTPPEITSSNIAYAEEGQLFNYSIAATPAPDSYSATGLPTGFSISTSTGVISGTPSAGQAGVSQVAISATRNGLTTTGSLFLVIESGAFGALTKTVIYQGGVSPTSGYEFSSVEIYNTDPASFQSGEGGVGLISGVYFRQIFGFNPLNVPSQATITNVQFVANTMVEGPMTPDVATPVTLQLYKAATNISSLDDLTSGDVNWNNDSDPDPSVPMLGAVTVTPTEDLAIQSWSSNSHLVSVVQNEIAANGPLFFLLRLSDADEANPDAGGLLFGLDSASSPQLMVTYTLPTPPLIPNSSAILVGTDESFSYQVPQVDGAAYSEVGLPFGLTIDPTTGLISGTTSQAGGFTVTVTITTPGGTSTVTLELNVATSASIAFLTDGVFVTPGVPFSYTPEINQGSGGGGAFSAIGLPAGLNIDPLTGTISGIPETFGVGATIVFSTIAFTNVTGTVMQALAFNLVPAFPPNMSAVGDANASFYYNISFSGSIERNVAVATDSSANLANLGLLVYLDSNADPASPPLVMRDSGSAPASSTSTAPEEVPIEIIANPDDPTGIAYGTVTVTLNPEVAPAFPPQAYNTAQGVAFSQQVSSTNTPSPADTDEYSTVNFSVVASSNPAENLPTGLSLDSSSGVISGTPTDAASVPVTYTPKIQAFSYNEHQHITNTRAGWGTITVVVYPPGPWISSPLTANVNVGHFFTYHLQTVLNNETIASATLVPNASGTPTDLPSGSTLPPGLTFNNNGNHSSLCGTPTEAGVYTLTLTATDANGASSTATLVLTVGSFTSSSSATGQVGVPFSFTVADNNGPTNFQASNLPAGATSHAFAIDSSTGVITGTPVTANTVPITVDVTDNAGVSSQVLTLTILPASSDSSAIFQQGISPVATYGVPSATIFSDKDEPSAAGTLIVGRTSANETARTLLGFDLSSLPAQATITSAQLIMKTISAVSTGVAIPVEVHQSLGDFDPASANWVEDSGTQIAVLSTASVDPSAPAGTNIAFPLSSSLTQAAQQDFAAGKMLDLTLLAPHAESNSATDAVGFAINTSDPTQNPKLVITYTVTSPSAPAITSPGVAYGISGVPFSYAITANNDPTSFGATGLPDGLTRTGASISGTINTVSTTVATVSAQNVAGTGTAQVTLNIDSSTPANGLQLLSGNHQVGAPSTFLSQPLIVTATRDGSPLADALVTFSVAKNEGSLSANGSGVPTSNTLTVITDGMGQASVYLYLPPSLRTTTVLAVSGTAPAVSFQETSASITTLPDDSLVMLSIVSGEGQSGTTSAALPFVVKATTVSGQLKASQQLAIAILKGGGGISGSSSGPFASTGTVVTDPEGCAIIYLQPGGLNGAFNEASCEAIGGGAQSVVYLTAMTGAVSGTNPLPTPGGGTPPGTDASGPPWQSDFPISVKILESDEDDVVSTPVDPDPTSINLHITPASANGLTEYRIDKKISTGSWELAGTAPANGGITIDGNTYILLTMNGLMANQDIHYRITPIFGDYAGTSVEVSYNIPLVKRLELETQYAGETGSATLFEHNADTDYSEIDALNCASDNWGGVFISPPGDDTGESPPVILSDVISELQNHLLDQDWHSYSAIDSQPYGVVSYDLSPWGGSSGVGFNRLGTIQGIWAETQNDWDNHPNEATAVYYGVSISQYRYKYYPASGTNEWYVMMYNPDPSNLGVRSDIVNSPDSVSDGREYDLNPYSYYENKPVYFALIPSAKIDVVADGQQNIQGQGGVALLDDNEKEDEGLAVSPNGFVSFTANSGGDEYTLTWTNGGSFEVYGMLGSSWAAIGNGETISSTEGFTGEFKIVATGQARDGDSTFVTLNGSMTGSSIGMDVCKFYFESKQGSDLTVPIDEASGPKYRKIALNGLPMSDEKPQQSAESGQEKEESYVDALTLGLRHSTTDIYLPVSGSDFAVSCRRDVRSQIWNDRSGLRPHEQPDLPFGMGWSSNLAPNIKFTHNNDPNNTIPDQAIVTDETGAVHTFYSWIDSDGKTQFFPMPTAKNEAQVPNLEILAEDDSSSPVTYTLTRKYGEALRYEKTTFTQSIRNDRTAGSDWSTEFDYARLKQATDRVGNVVNYSFVGTTNLIPKTISVVNQPGITLSIEQQPVSALVSGSANSQSVITAIWDANHNKTSFQYVAAPQDPNAVTLTAVTAPDGSTTTYSYDLGEDDDATPSTHPPNSKYYFVDIKSITDPLGNTYAFTYNLDHSKQNYMNDPDLYIGYYVQPGCPRNIHTISMPDIASNPLDVAIFQNNSNVKLVSDDSSGYLVRGLRQSVVTDATQFTRTYTFGTPDVVPLPSFPQQANNITAAKVVAYQSLNIAYGSLGGETIDFDINSAMAVSKVIDFSGNSTSYAHADAWATAPSTYTSRISGATFNGYYDDPTSQTNALGQPKYFTYFGPNRIMKSVTDENGNKTSYDIDQLNRRTKENIYDPAGTLVQETDFAYTNAKYPGFMTQKTVVALGGNDPAGTKSLVTQYVPDANGRVAEEIVDPNGLKLGTSYTYDANGNKLTALDPRGNTTQFNYDARNRLVTVIYADGSEKRIAYDARGNKKSEIDENGNATLYEYDALNRLKRQARDMNGNGQIDHGTDLVTCYTYNNANAKLTVADPNGGITQMKYDSIQRVTDIYDALTNRTQMTYGTNCGGNIFDSSSFKPTHSLDPRNFATDVTYDALYRPLSKTVQYATGQAPSGTSTKYDNVGNPQCTTDPLTHQTKTEYDALNRPTRTTYADGTKVCVSYTSTGLKWKTVDENKHSAQTEYDAAGRPVKITTGIADNAITASCPVTITGYDNAGNVISTLDPRLKEWDYVYDVRNRKVQEIEPSVYDADHSANVQPLLGWQYDAGGRTIAVVDARGNETDTVYDPANRVTDVNQPTIIFNGSSVRPNLHTTYDFNGNVLTVRDPNTHTTSNTYDALNRLLSTTDAAGDVVINGYDSVGNKTSVQDGDTNTTIFCYDGLNRNTRIIDAARHATIFTYNALNKTQRTDAKGQITTYQYDLRNRVQVVGYTGGGSTSSPRIYGYDFAGNLLSVTEPAQTTANVAYGYDFLNRVNSETSNGQTHTYSYDNLGNRIGVVYGGTHRTLTSVYDNVNRLCTLQDQTLDEIGASSPGRTTAYTYDLNGNIHRKTAPNSDTETYTYDTLNRATNESVQSGATTLYNCAYGYDRAGNVLTVGETYAGGLNNRTVTNSYDDANRLHIETAVGSNTVATTYTYDGANNRLSKSIATTASGSTTTDSTGYSYNPLNQLSGYGDGTRVVTLAYDLDGNRTGRTITGGSDAGSDHYAYDFENRLVSLNKGTSGASGSYSYQYDYRTRRIGRNEAAAGGANTEIVFSGGNSVQEYDNGADAPTVEYLRGSDYGGGVGGILYSVHGAVQHYTHANRRGDVVYQKPSDSSTPYQAQYDAFGKQVAISGTAVDRQKSNSKDTDPTGLVDEGFRYRDLDTGMFINRDPAGFVDGPNLYTYVVQNPWTSFDPEGLASDGLSKAMSQVVYDEVSPTAAYYRLVGATKAAVGMVKGVVDLSIDTLKAGGPEMYAMQQAITLTQIGAQVAADPGGAAQAATKAINSAEDQLRETLNDPAKRNMAVGSLEFNVGTMFLGGEGLVGKLGEASKALKALDTLAPAASDGGSLLQRMGAWRQSSSGWVSLGGKAAEEAKGGVYALRYEGEIVRTGRTNDLARRKLEHALDPVLGKLDFDPLYKTDSYFEQRGLEQMVHEQNAPILNKINPVSPNNPFGWIYENAANDFLEKL